VFSLILLCLLTMVSYPAVVSTTCALAVGYVAYIVFYRLYLHPLAKYPGPFWAKISDLPSYWYTRKQDRHVWLLKLQQQYGMSTRSESQLEATEQYPC
jgi:hypothetical protein